MTDLAEPPLAAVTSVDEMLAIAHAMEREAAVRYALLADCMRRVDQREVAELLDGLAAEERAHVDSVERLARQTLHRAVPAAPAQTALPRTFAQEDETSAAVLLSAYRTLSVAVRQEERAFAFWTYVSAHAPDAALRDLAETFARQELIHAAKLRQARRRAFHAERRGRPAARERAPAPAGAAMRGEAARLEAGVAAFCVAAEQQLRSGADIATADLFQSLGDEAQRAVAALDPTRAHVDSELERQTAIRRSEIHGVNGAALLFEAAGMIEDADYRYLEWLDAAARPEDVRDLEARAGAATARLARISERLYALEPTLAAIFGPHPGTGRSAKE
ncbi:MAG: ferritin family protein [Dongiaceae bacterium]